jgi:hypothetical protein
MTNDRTALLAIATGIAETENRVSQLRERIERLKNEGSDASQAHETPQIVSRNLGNLVMRYSGLMPTMEAIQQAVREPLSPAPRNHQAFAVYIFERARQLDRERALAKNLAEQRERRTTPE